MPKRMFSGVQQATKHPGAGTWYSSVKSTGCVQIAGQSSLGSAGTELLTEETGLTVILPPRVLTPGIPLGLSLDKKRLFVSPAGRIQSWEWGTKLPILCDESARNRALGSERSPRSSEHKEGTPSRMPGPHPRVVLGLLRAAHTGQSQPGRLKSPCPRIVQPFRCHGSETDNGQTVVPQIHKPVMSGTGLGSGCLGRRRAVSWEV